MVLDKVSNLYNIKFVKSESYQNKGYMNKILKLTDKSGSAYNLIIYRKRSETKKTIRNSNLISNTLHKKGFPVRQSIYTKGGNEIITVQSLSPQKEIRRFACLYNYLEGKPIPWDGYTSKHLNLVGWFMKDMHSIFDKSAMNYKVLGLPLISSVVDSQLNNMFDYFETKGVMKAMLTKLNLKIDVDVVDLLTTHLEKISKTYDESENTVLHMDLVRGNILFHVEESEEAISTYQYKKLKLSGVLDFETVAVGPNIYDIARSYSFLIVDCKYKTEEEIYQHFIKDGYFKNAVASPDSHFSDHLDTLVVFYLFYDFYRFLLHNPYQYLNNNQHYQRTRNLLVKHKVLRWR